jgi:hypothetical protein
MSDNDTAPPTPAPRETYEGVVVFGFMRSGTTLTRRLFDAHPAICCPPENFLLHACGRFLEEQPLARGLTLGVVSGCTYSGIEPEDLLGRVRDLAFGVFRDIARKQDKRIWADKTPANCFQIEAIERLCRDRCRYVILVRHPLDVICSVRELCHETEIYNFELHHYVRAHASPLVAFAHAWADAYTRLLELEARRPAACVRLRYEDLVANAPRELARVFDALGQPVDADALVRRALEGRDRMGLGDWKTYQRSTITDASVGRRRELSPSTVDRLLRIVGPVMERFGYDPTPPPVVPEGEEARRLHQLALMSSKVMADARAKKAP